MAQFSFPFFTLCNWEDSQVLDSSGGGRWSQIIRQQKSVELFSYFCWKVKEYDFSLSIALWLLTHIISLIFGPYIIYVRNSWSSLGNHIWVSWFIYTDQRYVLLT